MSSNPPAPPSGSPIDATPPPPAGTPIVEPAAPAAPLAEAPVAEAPARRRRRWKPGDIVLVSIIGALVVLLLVIVGNTVSIAVQSAQFAEARIGTQVAAEELLEGDCVRDFRRGNSPLLPEYTLVDCAAPHAAELVHIAEFDDLDVYLGDEASSDLAESICDAAMNYRLNIDDGVDELPNAFLFGVYQSRANWEVGTTNFQCFLMNRDGTPLTGGYYVDDELGDQSDGTD